MSLSAEPAPKMSTRGFRVGISLWPPLPGLRWLLRLLLGLQVPTAPLFTFLGWLQSISVKLTKRLQPERKTKISSELLDRIIFWSPCLIPTFSGLVLDCLGFLSPASQVALLICAIVFWVLLGTPAGYVSVFISIKWKTFFFLLTALFCPSFLFTVFFYYESKYSGGKSLPAISFDTLIGILAMWFGISVPLTFFGAYFGSKKKDYHWWWRAFFTSSFIAVYFFMYVVHYFFTKLQIVGISNTILYFGYMMITVLIFFIFTGTVVFFFLLLVYY